MRREWSLLTTPARSITHSAARSHLTYHATLVDLLDRSADRFSSQPALVFRPRYRTEVWTYRELRVRSLRVAGWLRKQGVREGDRVVLWAPGSPWWVAAYFGSLYAGATVVPLDLRSGPDFA